MAAGGPSAFLKKNLPDQDGLGFIVLCLQRRCGVMLAS